MWSSARIGEPAAVDRDGNKADRQFHSCCLLSLHFYSWQRIHLSPVSHSLSGGAGLPLFQETALRQMRAC